MPITHTNPAAFNCDVCSGPMRPVQDAKGTSLNMWHCERCGHRMTHEAAVAKEKEKLRAAQEETPN